MSVVSEKSDLNPLRLAKGPETSVITAQKLTRLKVNRIAIVQALKVEHILNYLVQSGVFSEEEKKEIQTSGNTQAKTRKLLDLLPHRGNNVDWYGHFRFALKNPEVRSTEVKKKYQILIEFLDNTIIQAPPRHKPQTPEDKNPEPKLPHYERLPSIEDSTSQVYSPIKTQQDSLPEVDSPTKTQPASRVTFDLNSSSPFESSEDIPVELQSGNGNDNENCSVRTIDMDMGDLGADLGDFEEWDAPYEIQNFSSLITEPTEHFQELENSMDIEDQGLLEKEMEVLGVMKRVEIVYALFKRKELPEEIVLTGAVEAMLSVDRIFHLYFKYLNEFKQKHSMDIMKDISISYCKFMLAQGTLQWNLVNTGFRLAEFLITFGQYASVDEVLMALISHLAKNEEMDNWMGIYECFVKIMEINNTNVNFQRVNWANTGVEQMTHKIKLMSFGKDIIDESRYNVEMSRLMQEMGKIEPALTLSQKALREVERNNKHGIIEALCNACRTLVLNHNSKKAQPLAVEAVRYARLHFGSHHPLYIKALLCFCHYCSEFYHKEISIEAAKVALKTAIKIYSTHSVVVAEAHQALSVALMTTQHFEDDTYFIHAREAWKCAKNVIDSGHPSLAPFQFTLGMALYWKSLYGNPEEADANISWAESEAKSALSMFEVSWGQSSLKAARTYVLLGLIYFRMKRYQESGNVLETALKLYESIVPAKSNYAMFAKSVYAIVLKVLGNMEKTISVAKDVIEDTDCGGIYLSWIKTTYDLLIDVLERTGSYKEAESYKSKLMAWQTQHPETDETLTWDELNKMSGSFEDFMKKYDIWHGKAQTIKKGIKSILQSKKLPKSSTKKRQTLKS